MTRILLSGFLASVIAVNGAAIAQYRKAPKLEGCATASQIIAAEAYNRGREYKDAFEFKGEGALFLSRWVGMAFPGVEPVVVVSYSDGSAALLSFVGAPECWRMQVMERRK